MISEHNLVVQNGLIALKEDLGLEKEKVDALKEDLKRVRVSDF